MAQNLFHLSKTSTSSCIKNTIHVKYTLQKVSICHIFNKYFREISSANYGTKWTINIRMRTYSNWEHFLLKDEKIY